jgi:hypothetical protein
MFRSIKSKLTILGAVLALALPLGAVGVANAQIANLQNNVAGQGCTGSNFDLTNATQTGCDTQTAGTGINGILKNIINIFSLVVGLVAVIMIIIGGFRYIVSGGESSSVSGAKNAILFAIVGLVIVALAQLIVHFVLAKAATAT